MEHPTQGYCKTSPEERVEVAIYGTAHVPVRMAVPGKDVTSGPLLLVVKGWPRFVIVDTVGIDTTTMVFLVVAGSVGVILKSRLVVAKGEQPRKFGIVTL